MKEIIYMSDEELKVHLTDLRMSRRKGIVAPIRSKQKKAASSTPEFLKNVNDDLANLVLAELAKRKSI